MMWCQRTDLASEAWALWRESAKETTALSGVRAREGLLGDFPVTEVEITSREGEGTTVEVTLGGAADE